MSSSPSVVVEQQLGATAVGFGRLGGFDPESIEPLDRACARRIGVVASTDASVDVAEMAQRTAAQRLDV